MLYGAGPPFRIMLVELTFSATQRQGTNPNVVSDKYDTALGDNITQPKASFFFFFSFFLFSIQMPTLPSIHQTSPQLLGRARLPYCMCSSHKLGLLHRRNKVIITCDVVRQKVGKGKI